MWIHYLIFASILHVVSTRDHTILPKAVIGAFFDKDAFMRKTFSLAVRTINKCMYDNEICELMHKTEDDVKLQLYHQVEFSAIAAEVDDDLTTIYKKFGQMAGARELHDDLFTYSSINEYGLSTVIGPHIPVSSIYMQALCEVHDLPHIVIKREAKFEHISIQTINLYPDTDTLSKIYIEMIKKLNWKSFLILYQDTAGLIALQDVLKMYPPYTHQVHAIRLGNGPNFSEPLLVARASPYKSFLLDCDYEILFDVLKQSQEMGLMSDVYKYIITSLDFQTLDLYSFMYTGANITGLRMVDPDDPFVSKFINNRLDDFEITSIDKLRANEAMIFDAVALFAQGYKDFIYANPIRHGVRVFKNDSQAEASPDAWRHGLSLRNYMLFNKMNGLSGPVMIDTDGLRRHFKLDVINLRHTGLTKVGTWDPIRGFDQMSTLSDEIAIEHFNVLITINPPYAMKVNHSKSVEGNARYEGFVVDIIKTMAKEMHFNYTLYIQEDSDNGNCTKNEKTDQCTCIGMMGKLLRKEMDMAITDLTITENRAQCITFSTTFWNLGMGILYKKPQKGEATWYSFFLPFSRIVWIVLGSTWIFTSFLFFAMGRVCPDEWTNPFPCIDEPTELHNQFTVGNSFWFTAGNIMQQGSEIAPIGLSTRCLGSFWGLFCLIIVNTYIANLAAFLTIENPRETVKGIEDLYNQTEIKFGAKKGGSTFTYFKSSSDPVHKQVYEKMTDPEWMKKWMVDKNEDGVALASREDVDYAFFTESPSIEYVQHRICNLHQAGGLIDHKAYAIGYAKDFKYVKEVDQIISKLSENLAIKALYKKWWTEKGAVCSEQTSNVPQPMNLDQVAGVYYVLTGGLLFALLVTIYEFVLDIISFAKSEDITFKEALWKELKSISSLKSTKPVLRKHKSFDTNCSDNYSCNLTMTTQT